MPISCVDAELVNVTSSSIAFDTVMQSGVQYVVTCTVDCYVKVAASPTASAADGNPMFPAGVPIPVAAKGAANKVAIIRASSDGVATLIRLEGVQ